jgi:hypothetical protein
MIQSPASLTGREWESSGYRERETMTFFGILLPGFAVNGGRLRDPPWHILEAWLNFPRLAECLIMGGS